MTEVFDAYSAYYDLLYKEKDWQAHRYKSIFSDSSCFFLTWNNQTLNERMQYVINDLTNLPAIESSYIHEEIIVYSSSYNPGKPFEVVASSLHSIRAPLRRPRAMWAHL